LRRLSCECWVRKEPEDVQPVIHGDHYDALARQMLAILARLGCAAGLKSAAKNPDHHGKLGPASVRRRPDVEGEAILAHPRIAKDRVFDDGWLHATRPETGGLSHAPPRRRGLRRLPAQT